MASDYTPTNITSGFQMEVAINQNFTDIKTAIDKLLNREVSTDNAMEQDFNIGGFNLLNLPAPVAPTHPVRLTDVNSLAIPDVVQTLTFATSLTVDPSLMTIADLTLTGNTTILLQESVTITDGRPLMFRIRQDGVGSHTVTFISPARFSTDVPHPTITVTASALDYILFRYNTADLKYDCLAVNRGFT